MPHIARIGSKSPRTRLGIAAIYAVLILGAITTVYPFLLMVGTGMKSQNDYNDFTPGALVPRYLYDDAALFNKYAEDKYANNLDDINAAYNTNFDKPVSVAPPSNAPSANLPIESWSDFVTKLPPSDKKVGFAEHDAAPSLLLLKYRDWLRNKFNDDIRTMNEAYTEESVSFDTVAPPFERTALRDWRPDLTKSKVRDWYVFRETLPGHFFIPMLADPMYRTWLRQEVYEEDLADLNVAWGTKYDNWNAVVLPRTAPEPTKARGDWETFVRTKLPLRMTGGVPVATAPVSSLIADTPENRWRATMKNNNFSDSTPPPQGFIDNQYVTEHKAELRQDYATRNFRTVAGYIFLHGNAVPNTVIFCVLAILSAVIVNPLCAYALSRYPLPYAYQVLLFLLATMAFPAEVAMIPNFLLLRDLHLLNTFWALVLPGLANGFSIFLLKGFFDSLPKELYEAGILDGATEVSMFRTITVPLSLPIFSVIALNAFTASYGAFLFAMVVCQDPKMWTLMVWLYDLQASAPQYVIMAALTLAALPTLIVFMFAQKIIMRGIILPSFK